MGRRPTMQVLVIATGVGIALVGLAVLLVMRGAGSTAANRLAVGDCFDVPSATDRIGDLRRRACSEPHGGEVFHVYDSPLAASAAYPSDTDWETIVFPTCDPEFETYTGTPVGERVDIEYRYLVPTPDRWTSGERGVTCFIISPDGSPLSRSFRANP